MVATVPPKRENWFVRGFKFVSRSVHGFIRLILYAFIAIGVLAFGVGTFHDSGLRVIVHRDATRQCIDYIGISDANMGQDTNYGVRFGDQPHADEGSRTNDSILGFCRNK